MAKLKEKTLADVNDTLLELQDNIRSLQETLATGLDRLAYAAEQSVRLAHSERSFNECEDCGCRLVAFQAESCPACGSKNVFDDEDDDVTGDDTDTDENEDEDENHNR